MGKFRVDILLLLLPTSYPSLPLPPPPPSPNDAGGTTPRQDVGDGDIAGCTGDWSAVSVPHRRRSHQIDTVQHFRNFRYVTCRECSFLPAFPFQFSFPTVAVAVVVAVCCCCCHYSRCRCYWVNYGRWWTARIRKRMHRGFDRSFAIGREGRVETGGETYWDCGMPVIFQLNSTMTDGLLRMLSGCICWIQF